ncbi:MAG: NmrA family NAD(P)-binding protein [Planctomycetota bacterium]
MSKQRILVFGATGQVGGAAIEYLAQNGEADLYGVTRSADRAPLIEARGAKARVIDIDDNQSVHEAVQGIDSLLLITGYTVEMLRQSIRVIDAAKAAGVKHVVHVGASGSPTAEVAHWDWHRMIEAYIERSGFTFVHLHPESFLQNLTGFGWLQPGVLLNLIGDARWSWVDASDVGAMAGAALLQHDALLNRSVPMGYDAASMSEIADRLRDQLGLELQLADTSPDAFYEAAVSSGAEPTYMACVRDQLKLSRNGEIPDVDLTFDSTLFREVTGHNPTTLHAFIEKEVPQLLATQNRN